MCHIHPRWSTAVKRAPFMACWRVEWVRARLGTGAEPWRCPDQGAWAYRQSGGLPTSGCLSVLAPGAEWPSDWKM